MQYRPFGSTGQQVSVIGMGTWYIDLADRDTAIRALQTGLDHGMNHIDTAEMYGDAEFVIQDAIRERRSNEVSLRAITPASRNGPARLLRFALARPACRYHRQKRRDTSYGHKLNLVTGRSGLILDVVICNC